MKMEFWAVLGAGSFIILCTIGIIDTLLFYKYSIEFKELKDVVIKQSELIEKQYAIIGNLEDEVAAIRAYEDDGK